jgi:hypothetical protein
MSRYRAGGLLTFHTAIDCFRLCDEQNRRRQAIHVWGSHCGRTAHVLVRACRPTDGYKSQPRFAALKLLDSLEITRISLSSCTVGPDDEYESHTHCIHCKPDETKGVGFGI